ncbi:hypothetical protein C5B42_02555 [Candidatus Cerribacteria bacterium 'Amazon FNV 2010 28 9']|uniref:Uncharacterized protein n=1 Tax=Candidatus Cerribacteria bacterium 'Amazon FNV 2010 28 9' TaxID=2081795 RepID=A0A317JQ41_9BACT|nr:MAG: hypothetical protein C5B42_02555 [Candidatus Cerribacteria bacterium 'Amazon FNV 2010 28 9']
MARKEDEKPGRGSLLGIFGLHEDKGPSIPWSKHGHMKRTTGTFFAQMLEDAREESRSRKPKRRN